MSAVANEVRQIRLRDYDPDLLRGVINGGDMEHAILKSGNCSADVCQWSGSELTFNRGFYDFPTFVRGSFPGNNLCIGIAQGRHEPVWINGHQVDARSIQVYAEGCELLYRAGRDTDWAAITIPREVLQRQAIEQLGHELSLPASGMWNLSVDRLHIDRCLSLVNRATETLPGASLRTPIREREILSALVELVAIADPLVGREIEDRVRYRLDTIQRADSMIRSLIEQGGSYLSLPLCRALGISERGLQMHFKEALGLGPKAWFRCIAMNRVRSELIQRDNRPGSVAETAVKYGFDHLGRFSRDYRELFGESPSETLRRKVATRF